MTQIALIALALVAAVAAAVLARSRAGAVARAAAAETALTRGEERARVAEGRLARTEQQLREAQETARRSTDEARRAEGRTRAAEDAVHEAQDVAREAQEAVRDALRQGAAATTRAEEADHRLAAAEARAAALLAEIGHLAQERVAATAVRLSHANAPVVGPLDPQIVGPEAVRALQSVLDATAAALADERERVDAAARAAMRGATSRIQTLLYQIQSLVQQLQHDNDDPRLLEVDFRNEVALRRIQTVAVLCEAWPGLARTDSPLAEVVVGALSRVPGYARVKVANHLREHRLAVVARAAEPIAVTIAELLANATAYSHPETDVPVTVQQGGRGALVIIDDSGIGMDEDQLRRARRLLSGPPDLLLTELGNPPKTGFAVIGKLARQYGFSCHIEPSPYGGMRTILRIPAGLVTVVDDEQPLSVLTPLPLRAGSGPASAPTVAAVPPMRDADEQDGPQLADRHHQPGPHPAPAIRVVPDPGTGGPSGDAAVPDGRTSPASEAAPASQASQASDGASAARASGDAPADDGTGLPTRRRRRPLAPEEAGAPAATAGSSVGSAVGSAGGSDAPGRSPERAAARWQALQQGTDSGRAAVAQAERESADRAAAERASAQREAADRAGAATQDSTTPAGTPGDTTTARPTGDHTTGPTTLEGAEQ
ncbi:ATP-binding protein [Kitasatospora sp. NPDC101447]|uniref:ATP-binding protein n=1 Tax=Kitasatospora sp. NPDC101447 TaxID=3364102 RepID=UPI00381AC1AB